MKSKTDRLNAWDRIMMAITFAEAGEDQTAREILENRKTVERPESRTRKEADKRPELHV